MFKNYFKFYFLFSILLLLFICIFILPNLINNNSIIITSQTEFYWPTPNYHIITSNFGYRNAPTNGASTYHSGVDIGAAEDSSIHSICDGYVTYTGFKGAGGYTITINASPYTISYCHVNPNFEVEISEYISKGEIIGKVGPKYIEPIANNTYKDSSGNQTNGATTGPHLHLTVKLDGENIDPLSLFPDEI
jgi:murein DD-endopeptidase MepM/ murein hydrolase activator NlpD